MPSRVIHIRMDDWVLLGCHDVMKTGSKSVENIPMATIVRQVITSLIRKLQNTGQIPTYTKEEAYERAMELYGGAEELDLNIALSDLVSPDENTEGEEMETLLKETLRQIENEGEPRGITEKVEISAGERIEEIDTTHVNILNLESPSFDFYLKDAPKDRFIEWAQTQEKLIQKAVSVVYEGLPKQLWGSNKAESMIKNLLDRHRED